jgi:hypothetical protein
MSDKTFHRSQMMFFLPRYLIGQPLWVEVSEPGNRRIGWVTAYDPCNGTIRVKSGVMDQYVGIEHCKMYLHLLLHLERKDWEDVDDAHHYNIDIHGLIALRRALPYNEQKISELIAEDKHYAPYSI